MPQIFRAAINGLQAPQGVAGAGAGAGGPVADARQAKQAADPRFRSFVERYMIERAAFFRTDFDGHLEDQYQCICDAKRAYDMINRVGQGHANKEAEF